MGINVQSKILWGSKLKKVLVLPLCKVATDYYMIK